MKCAPSGCQSQRNCRQNMAVDFNEDFHEYTTGGVKIPSVTQILKNAGYIDDRFFTSESRDRGTAVHELCRRYADGIRADDSGRPLESLEYVNAFSNWMKNKKVFVVLSETVVHGDKNQYAGKFDILADIAGKKVLVDIKTGVSYYWHSLQLAAYATAILPSGKMVSPAKCMDLYLKSDGTYQERYIPPVDLINYITEWKSLI